MKSVRVLACLLSLVVSCAAQPRPSSATRSPSPRHEPIGVEGSPSPEGPASEALEEDTSPVPLRRDNPSWGRRDALVTVVEFADLQCPFCQRVESALADVRRVYGPEKVRIVWKHSPLAFHEFAKSAAEAAQGVFAVAGSDAFWKFHDAALNGQASLGLDSYMKWAEQAGVADRAALRSGLENHAWGAAVERDLADGAGAGVGGTPSFFINGVSLAGAQPFEAFQRIIDEQLAESQAALQSGTPRSRLYFELTSLHAKAEAAQRVKAQAVKDYEQDPSAVFRIPIGTSPSLGREDASVTIVEFGDFQCPFCKRVEATMKDLRNRYGDKIRIVWKHKVLPFHPQAEPAAELAMAARARGGDSAFWKMGELVFDSQPDLADETLLKLAAKVGLREDQAHKVLAEHPYRAEIERDDSVADDFGVNGSPTFFINGRKVVGNQPVEVFVAVVDEEIKKVQDLVARGTPPKQVYDALTKGGRTPPPLATKNVPKSLKTGGPSRGSSSAKVVIHEFADFECPYCSHVDAVLARVLKDYGTKVKLVWHDMPLAMHAHARLAASAAHEVLAEKGVEAFWRFHDKLLADQNKLTRDVLDGYASEARMDPARWKAALDGEAITPAVEADIEAAHDAGIDGTPAFLVVAGGASEGYFIEGAQGYWAFRKAIARALGEEP